MDSLDGRILRFTTLKKEAGGGGFKAAAHVPVYMPEFCGKSDPLNSREGPSPVPTLEKALSTHTHTLSLSLSLCVSRDPIAVLTGSEVTHSRSFRGHRYFGRSSSLLGLLPLHPAANWVNFPTIIPVSLLCGLSRMDY